MKQKPVKINRRSWIYGWVDINGLSVYEMTPPAIKALGGHHPGPIVRSLQELTYPNQELTYPNVEGWLEARGATEADVLASMLAMERQAGIENQNA